LKSAGDALRGVETGGLPELRWCTLRCAWRDGRRRPSPYRHFM